MSSLRTSPTAVPIGVGETFALGVDFSRYLTGIETVNAGGAPTAFLYDESDGDANVSATCLVGTPTVSGNIVTPILTALELDHNYRLETFIKPNGIESRKAVTLITCDD